MFGRTKIAMIVAEFLGTATIAAVVMAVGKSGLGFSVFLAASAGLALATFALTVGPLSGAHCNPAVTLGLWTTRKIPTSQALMYVAAQFLGGYAAYSAYTYMADQPLKSIAGRVFDWRVFAAEALGAFVLTFVVAGAVYQGYRGLRFAAALGGGLFLGILIASIGSNGVINPAVALGLRSWSRAYFLGPFIGGVIGANLYGLLFAPAETRVASLADDDTEATVPMPAQDVSTKRSVVAKKSATKKTTRVTTRRTKK